MKIRAAAGRAAALAFVMTALLTGSATAQPALDSNEALRAALTPGQQVTVQDVAGRRVSGRVGEISPASLVLVRSDAWSTPVTVAFDRVARVTREDSTRNGFWLGFAIGAVPGALTGAMVSTYCYNEGPHHCPGAIVVLGGLTGLAGGGIGRLVDARIKGGPVLFDRSRAVSGLRVHPEWDPVARRGGVSLSMSF